MIKYLLVGLIWTAIWLFMFQAIGSDMERKDALVEQYGFVTVN